MNMFLMLIPLLGTIKNNSYPKKLTKEEETELLFLFKHKDKKARDKLIEHNLRLVGHIVKKYNNTLEDKDDLLSIGTMGLIKGVDSFKFDSKTKLSTYVARCIENEILMKLRSNKKRKNDSWLYSAIGYDKEGNAVTLIDVIKDDSICVESDAILDESIINLRKSFKTLDEREKDIITKRYGLGKFYPKTQKDISNELNISRSYVSRIEKRALLKLYFELTKEKENLSKE